MTLATRNISLDASDLSTEISENALEAAIDFVEICCQHAAYIAGHGKIEEELDLLESGNGTVHIAYRTNGLLSTQADSKKTGA